MMPLTKRTRLTVWLLFLSKSLLIESSAHQHGHIDTSFQTPSHDSTQPPPESAAAFDPFDDHVKVNWDDTYLYIETNSLPEHEMMVGITAWNQQVPLPQNYTGTNRWQLPLHPVPATKPIIGREALFRGAIAIAVNGVPIFNPIKNDGKTDTNLAGELDEFGGHAGRADDYHYHLPPTFLNERLGDEQPIGFGLDGYPLYGYNEPDGTPARNLDQLNGHKHGDLGYHYHSSKDYPYLNGGLRGKVTVNNDEVEQPRTQPVRPFTQPLRGAKIVAFNQTAPNAYSLGYDYRGGRYTINYSVEDNGTVDFEFVDPKGNIETDTYRQKTSKDNRPPRGPKPDESSERRPPERTGGDQRQPWVKKHADELDANNDGTVALSEVMEEAKAIFMLQDQDGDRQLTLEEMTNIQPQRRSPVYGFLEKHNLEMDEDGDSKVSAKELADQFKQFFYESDLDNNGRLTPNELQ
ncbi:YHYH protein [Rubellicoccus peritrichatus]|uniref:YHYH protein n=1 Tax=Rubellicoccus peritrichatus TaxID=3080537 RepID=A0AAQ3LAW3_9BACT|nr:YHYH protein [Puniceicoccus sp. CR14]WOO41184.1 YHYH protein [Puniceicoccus sp. CR14]